MSEIRYVVLSDLHFGAENSVLTSVVEDAAVAGVPGGPAGGPVGPGGAGVPGGPAGAGVPGGPGSGPVYRPDPTTPSPLLVAMLDGLRHLTAGQQKPPTLILAGDVLDLALSPDAVAAAAFEGFVDRAFCGADRIFAPAVYYLPGNHDHHLWESAREAQYITYLRHLPPDDAIAAPWHTTTLLPERQPPWTASDLMSTLIQRRPGGADVAVRVVYPNLALTSADGNRCRIISHGHYTESIYTLMSQLRAILFPQQDRTDPPSIDLLESENFAWIDFFWSTLGRSGDVGADVGLIYADMNNASALNALASNLVRGLLKKGHGPGWTRPLEIALAVRVVSREIRHMAKSERGTPDVTLTPKSRLGVSAYLEGPLLQQIVADLGSVPRDLGFIFGHTHKPFVETWSVTGYPAPVEIHNTGGWVVDTAEPAVSQGGVAVLLDEDLNVASLQFYRQNADGGTEPVQLLPSSGQGSPNPLYSALAASVQPAAEPWSRVTAAATDMVGLHHRVQAALVQSGIKGQ
jgi:hypothetical protein